MTNGEMIQKDFDCEVCEPILEDDIIHVIFPDKNDSAIGFDLSWWNMEYKEPTTRNCFGCKYSKDNHIAGTEECHLCMWENQYTPTTKNNLGVDCIDRQATLDEIIKRLGIKNESYLLPSEKVLYQQIKDMPSVTPQEPILDKIRAEIEELSHYYPMGHDYQIAITRCLAVIDKYRNRK